MVLPGSRSGMADKLKLGNLDARARLGLCTAIT